MSRSAGGSSSCAAFFAKKKHSRGASSQFAALDETQSILPPSAVPSSSSPLWGPDVEPQPPSLALAKERAQARLAKDPTTGRTVGTNRFAPRAVDFEFLGLGVHSYVTHLHRMRFFFMLLALLSVSSLVANGYGGQLTDKQISPVTWLFTGASLGNADEVSPSTGATEFLISSLMTLFLYWSLAALDEDAHRVEQKQVTPADFAVMVSGLPTDLTAAPIERALGSCRAICGYGGESANRPVSIVVALHQRELILAHREMAAHHLKRQAYAADVAALRGWQASRGALTEAAAARLAKLSEALERAEELHAALRAKVLEARAAHGYGGPLCAGTAFVTLRSARDALALLENGTILLPELSEEPFPISRPPEPSDVIWENLGCADAFRRQVRGTLYMTLLSLLGAFLIGASSYLQPKAVERNANADKGAAADLQVAVVGLLVLLFGYLVVFITVPIVEVSFMRHTSVTGKEVSQVLKLVLFQVMATLSTIGSFAADTAGAFNRDWYITGGFMLVNGMLVDLFVITCLIQGWGLVLNIGRLVVAPKALTQLEMDLAWAGDGANMYVVDRLQLVTKFVVMCYICSAAIPLLHWVVLLVLAISIFIDETNLLRRLYPAPQSDESVVRCILVFVMPLAVLLHLIAAGVFYSQLRAPSAHGIDSPRGLSSYLVPSLGFGVEAEDGQNLVVWSTWVNAPLTLLFIAHQWPKYCGGAAQPPAADAAADEASSTAMVGRAIAGSVWTSKARPTDEGGSNEALRLTYSDLELLYHKAGRSAELRYLAPQTSLIPE